MILAPHTVGVLGSGTEPYEEYASDVGASLAALGVNLLTGGGSGVMEAVSRAFTRSPRDRGICIGVLACASERDRATPKPGYPNRYVELAIHTHLPCSGEQGTHDLSRNHINVLSSIALIALPGGAGTASEVALALRYARPIVVYPDVAALTGHFDRSARRVATVAEVREFLSGFAL